MTKTQVLDAHGNNAETLIPVMMEQHEAWLETDGQSGEQADFTDWTFSYFDFSKLHLLESVIFNKGTLYHCNFSHCNLQYATFHAADVSQSVFYYADMMNAELVYTKAEDTSFDFAYLAGATLTGLCGHYTHFYKTDLTNAHMEDVLLWHGRFIQTTFYNNMVHGASFKYSKFYNVELNLHQLTGSDMSGCSIIESQFNVKTVKNVDFRHVHAERVTDYRDNISITAVIDENNSDTGRVEISVPA